MKLTTPQVAEKLGTTNETVLRMRNAGILHDLASTSEGKSRHSGRFDSKEVAQIARIYQPRMQIRHLRRLVGTPPLPSFAPSLPIPPRHAEESTSSPAGALAVPMTPLFTALVRIEGKLDRILKAWHL